MTVTPLEFWEEAHTTNPHHLTGENLAEVLGVLLLDRGIFFPGKTVLNVGVGNALQYPELAATGCEILSLDISPSALQKVAKYGPGYLPHELPNLPTDSIDIALSRLVAQHMFDDELRFQLQHVFRALKPDGFLAMQFAGCASDIYNDRTDWSTELVLCGGAIRSNEFMVKLVEQAGGHVVLDREVPTIPPDPTGWVWWRIIHARKVVP